MIKLQPIDRIGTISKKEFITAYKHPEIPVVMEQLTHTWPAYQKWHLDYFCDIAGDNIVPVYDGGERAKGRQHQNAVAQTMRFRDFIAALKLGENRLRIFFYNILTAAPKLIEDFAYPDIGLKFFTKLPVMFFGGKGAKVQMHFDIDLADILLCHFGGRKRVYLFAPAQTKYLYHVPFSFSALFDIDVEQPDYERFPALHQLEGYVIELVHGDALYIPPGYWHYIVYEEISFSLSLRAFPRHPKALMKMFYNIVFIRNVEGLMRKLAGQLWNDRNELNAFKKTHRNLAIELERSGKF
ncbi:MAG: cupin-like domain-containing protein [Methylococcaceae bacterium]|nr:cupin-like domain-containing protein [Methylococcaceae bacterium]